MYVQGKNTQDSEIKEIINEISEVRRMCRSNFNGQVELEFLPYEGGFYEQPAVLLDRIFLIIGYLNQEIAKEQKRNNR